MIKNSTKRVDDEIFVLNENIRILKKDLENISLEYEYLSSAEKLIEYKNLYFDEGFIKKDIKNIKIINQNSNKIELKDLKFNNE
tara:strand:+ start:98 stop:349 length:252 start_codon:yes stop_codon:yes gene_type:complete